MNAYKQISGDGEEGCKILCIINGMLYIDTVQKIVILYLVVCAVKNSPYI